MAGSPLEATRATVAQHIITSPTGVEEMQKAQGSYQSRAVETKSETAKLTDASEELGMSVAHRSDKKSLGQREVRQGQSTNLEALARIADYYDKLPNMPREDELKALVDLLQSFENLMEKGGGGGGGQVSKEDILAALQQFDGDVSHQFAALDIAIDQLKQSGASSELIGLLEDARGEYERGDLGRDVRAGLAAGKLADQKSATLETDPGAVRDTYRSLLRESGNIGKVFDALTRMDMSRKFTEVVETFIEIVGRDIDSTGPSSDPGFLHGLMTELRGLQKMRTAFDGAKDLIDLTERPLPRSEKGMGDPVDVTSRMLNFASKMATGLQDARALLGGFANASPQTQVVFANGLKGLHAMLPDDLIPSPQARQQQISSIMGLLGVLVDNEDAAYEDEANKSSGKKRDEQQPTN